MGTVALENKRCLLTATVTRSYYAAVPCFPPASLCTRLCKRTTPLPLTHYCALGTQAYCFFYSVKTIPACQDKLPQTLSRVRNEF